MSIKIPALPSDPHTTGWRRTVTGVAVDLRGIDAVEGAWVDGGDVVTIPSGTLILAVDKHATGWDNNYRTGERYAVQDATVTVYLVEDDTLTEVWTRHYKTASSALGATTLKKLTALLAKRPAPEGAVEVIEEARRLNRKTADCRWCNGTVYAQGGHLVGHGDQAQVEHWQDCPPRTATAGAPCALCGVTVAQADAQQYLVREWPTRWETRHRPHLNCTRIPLPSYEQQQEELKAIRAEQQAQAEKQRKREAATAARKIQREADRRAAVAAETARVAGLKVTERTETEIFSKNLGSGVRAQLLKYVDELEDGTTTTRWAVLTVPGGSGFTGEDYDPAPVEEDTVTLDEQIARSTYRSMKWTPPARGTSRDHGNGTCAECHQGTARHDRRDSSGIEGRVCNRCNTEPDYMLSFA